MSKQLDPLDPTPWFYNAIRMQTINRPVEALQDLQQSIELNDNRAVYRSRLALDEDLAVRGASITRIYENLGFNQLAQIEASRSLRLDPSNHSAHRFLSDAYSRLPQHEIARISELLQSQLLQPVNINPVQPGLPFIGLNPVSRIGPAESRSSEYSSLFERDQLQLTASGAIGNMDSLDGEVIASGLWDDLSFSAGISHSETDGFRDNNDQENEIYNLFAQWAVSPRLSLQGELRHRETEQGDLNFNFDPEDFFANDRRNFDEDILRLGARIDAAPGSTFLLSVIHGNLDEQLVLVDEIAGSVFTLDDQAEDEGDQLELQNILVGEGYNVITGFGVQRADVSYNSVELENGAEIWDEEGGFDREYQSIYLYGGFDYSPALKFTLGAGYLDFTEDQKDVEEFEPKLGVEWEIVENVRLRGAYFKSAKRPLIVSQTIEPTQVAGFNQLYDDTNGSLSERAGVGIDTSLGQNVFAGFEISRREIDFLIGTAVEKRQEDLFQAYLNWMISERWAFTLDMAYEDYTNEDPLESDGDTPLKLESLTIPASIRYFAPSGLFAELQTTYLMQDLERGEDASLSEGEEDVVLLDLAIGYRFSRRRGTISLNVLNALDESFFYQDDSFRSTDVTRSSGFIPERRTVLLISYVF
ncbi:MAG: TonB-dependent receptor [Rhodothermales bacterium]|nr:TonB-dependent receptor [Rhodothermales bacterium]